ncbi:hypothetical protein TURU_088975 [Turdus rufiventris]|nr:hypothetical protein TURU_088975 [Turdus rufiventris]
MAAELWEEMEKFQGSEGKKEDEEKKYLDVISNKNIKLSERVLIPVKQYPKIHEMADKSKINSMCIKVLKIAVPLSWFDLSQQLNPMQILAYSYTSGMVERCNS